MFVSCPLNSHTNAHSYWFARICSTHSSVHRKQAICITMSTRYMNYCLKCLKNIRNILASTHCLCWVTTRNQGKRDLTCFSWLNFSQQNTFTRYAKEPLGLMNWRHSLLVSGIAVRPKRWLEGELEYSTSTKNPLPRDTVDDRESIRQIFANHGSANGWQGSRWPIKAKGGGDTEKRIRRPMTLMRAKILRHKEDARLQMGFSCCRSALQWNARSRHCAHLSSSRGGSTGLYFFI